MKTIRFGIIGCGLMGKEFASAVARWCHLIDSPAKPEIVSICNRSDKPFAWFTQNFASIKHVTHDYRELLNNDEVDAVYIALPHHLHAQTYAAVIESGKHLMGEKPFGIDAQANTAILSVIDKYPDVFVRCVSQFPFFPAVQEIGRMLDDGAFGRVIEVETGFLHSSDLNPDKAINWKRMIEFNGAYGVMGDLGMHACHVPLRAGWRPRNVRAVLNNIMADRPDSSGKRVPCETWDNATLLIDAHDPATGDQFPWAMRTHRISPGQTNSWYVNIAGTQAAVRFNTAAPKRLDRLHYVDGKQIWQTLQTGYETAYPTITGPIFEFGFTDAILQMWAAFMCELETGHTPSRFGGCVTPEEVAVSHQLFTAALASQEQSKVVEI